MGLLSNLKIGSGEKMLFQVAKNAVIGDSDSKNTNNTNFLPNFFSNDNKKTHKKHKKKT